MRRIRSMPAAISLIVLLTLGCVACPSASLAAPTTPQIAAKQAQAAAAAKKLQALADDLESKREDYLAVSEALQQTRTSVASTQKSLGDTQTKLDAAQALLSDRADAMYRSGSVDILQVLLGTTDFEDFLSRLDILNRISGSDADLVSQVTSARDAVAQTEASLQDREQEQVVLRTQAQAAQNAVQDAVSSQTQYVASLNAQVKKLVKAEAARQAAIAAAKAQAARARQDASAPSPRQGDVGNLGQPHPAAADVAAKYIGVPYLWGGESPHGFDCSGLAQYCYAQIGISIPRTSREQFKIGDFIPADRTDLLERGDLVFFGTNGDPSRVHHVGIYAGGGTFIEAPYTGADVRYSQLSSRSDYVGGVRP
jgi:cell wall-associated NlpC family hydrolase